MFFFERTNRARFEMQKSYGPSIRDVEDSKTLKRKQLETNKSDRALVFHNCLPAVQLRFTCPIRVVDFVGEVINKNERQLQL